MAGQFDHLRKEEKPTLVRNGSEVIGGRTGFLLRFKNAVELGQEHPVANTHFQVTRVEALLDGSQMGIVPIDRDDNQGGSLGISDGSLRNFRQLQRGQTPEAEVQFTFRRELIFKAVAKLLRPLAGANALVNE